MRIFLFFLIFCNLIIPALYFLRENFPKVGVEIDHVLLFTFGFIFYWIFPIFVGIMRFFDRGYSLDDPHLLPAGAGLWYEVFDRIGDYRLIVYLLWCLACYISFISADVLGKKIFTRNDSEMKKVSLDVKLANILLIFGIASAAVFGYTLRNGFFTGYRISPFFEWKGSFSASIVFILSLFFLYSTEIQERLGDSAQFGKVVLNRFFVAASIGLVLLTSLGGRTFFISAIAMLLVYKSVFFKRIRLQIFFFCFAGITTFAALMPLIRARTPLKDIFFSDSMLVNIKKMSYVFFSDPIFTSHTLITALSKNILPLIKFPVFLSGALVNLIPTFLFPSKGNLILHASDYGYPDFIPYMGVNSFYYFIINFGLLGTVIVLFLFSLFLVYLKNSRLPVFKSMYVMISGWTAFTLFRDPETTIIKMMLEFSILMPIFVVLFPAFLLKFIRKVI